MQKAEGEYKPAERWAGLQVYVCVCVCVCVYEREREREREKFELNAHLQAKQDPVGFAKWKQYKNTRDYQIKCQVWGQVGGC